MNTSDQNKNIQKQDFDFILNQSAPNGPHRPFKKKLIVLYVLVFLLLVALIVGMILMPSRNVQEETVAVATEEQVTIAYFKSLSGDDYSSAYNLLSNSAQQKINMKDNENLSQWLDDTGVVIIDCELYKTIKDRVVNIDYVCPAQQGNYEVIFSLLFVKEKELVKIDEYSIDAREVSL